MTVRELILLLAEAPPDATVYVMSGGRCDGLHKRAEEVLVGRADPAWDAECRDHVCFEPRAEPVDAVALE